MNNTQELDIIDIQKCILEHFSRKGGSTTLHLKQDDSMLDYVEDDWLTVKSIVRSMNEIGIISNEHSFAETRGKVYQITDIGRKYLEFIKDK